MSLNIFPRRREATALVADPEPEAALPEPSPEALDEPRKRARRGTRGGRGRRRAGDESTGELGSGEESEATGDLPAEEAAPPAPAPRRRRAAAVVEPVVGDEPPADATAETVAEAPAPARRSRARAVPAVEPSSDSSPALQALEQQVRQLEQQNRQLEQTVRNLSDGPRRGSSGPMPAVASSAPPQRVGVFVDAANIELACDRLRARFDWGKVLRMLTQDRQLIRALAYSPVHDDPNVSIETQRFVEPFLDKGYKVETKPLRRFQDGSVKANVDIELALDVLGMLDRLDVVVLVSGDGDFQRLVTVCQSRGVRVEVAAVGSSTATNLKHAADSFIDLASRLRDIRA